MTMPSKDDILIEEQFAQTRMKAGTFRRLMSYVRPYRRLFIINLVFTVLATISQLLGPKFIQLGIDRHLTHIASAETAARGILIISAVYLANLVVGWLLSIIK